MAQCWRMRLPTQEIQVWSLGWEDPLEKEMAPHSSTLAWRAPRTESLVGYRLWGHKESDTSECLNHRCRKQQWDQSRFACCLDDSAMVIHLEMGIWSDSILGDFIYGPSKKEMVCSFWAHKEWGCDELTLCTATFLGQMKETTYSGGWQKTETWRPAGKGDKQKTPPPEPLAPAGPRSLVNPQWRAAFGLCSYGHQYIIFCA